MRDSTARRGAARRGGLPRNATREARRPAARPSSQAAPWTVEEWCGDAASRRFPLGKPPRGTEFCLQPLAVGFGTPPVCADRSGKQSSSARKMFPRTSPIDPTRCRDSTDSPATGHCVARERGGGPRTLPVAHSRATPASPSPRSAHPASVVRPHAQTEASSRCGKFLNSPRSSARGVSLRPTGFRARGHREKTRRRRLRGASTLNRRAHSSRGEYPLLYTHHGAAHW